MGEWWLYWVLSVYEPYVIGYGPHGEVVWWAPVVLPQRKITVRDDGTWSYASV